MKLLASALAIFMAVVLWAPIGITAQVDTFGFVSASGGAEKEGDSSSGGRFIAQGLGVLPVRPNLGLQGMASYVGGRGSRFGVNLGPIYGWSGGLPLIGGTGGKTGVIFAYQHRSDQDDNFVWIRPSLGLYYSEFTINSWISQSLTETRQHGRPGGFFFGPGTVTRAKPMDQIRLEGSYYPMQEIGPYLKRDNWELTAGLQLNNPWGGGFGAGPVLGVSVMPMNNLVVNAFRFAVDSESRYRFDVGLQYTFGGPAKTLKDTRRQYVEPANGIDAPGSVSYVRIRF